MDCFASARNDGMEAHGDPKLALGWCEAAVGGSIPHKGGTVTKGGGALPWIGSLLHMALNGRKKFTPNEIGEFHFGEGSELTDRSGLRFRTRYRDVLETILSFGGGDLLAFDNHQTVVKRWDNVIGLFFFWKDLDRVLHQRAAVMDSGEHDLDKK